MSLSDGGFQKQIVRNSTADVMLAEVAETIYAGGIESALNEEGDSIPGDIQNCARTEMEIYRDFSVFYRQTQSFAESDSASRLKKERKDL